MWKRSEGFFEGYQDAKLFFQVWDPPAAANGLLVITHGHGEHSEAYHRLIKALEPLGYRILAWDLRGHGRSSGQRGYVASFLDYVRDFEAFHNQVVLKQKDEFPEPVFFAHSMGALVQLKALSSMMNGTQRTQILTSPFLGLALEVPQAKQIAAKFLQTLLPRVTLHNEINPVDLSRDLDVQNEYSRDFLRHRKISSAAYLGALESAESVLVKPDIWQGRMLILLAEQDPVVNTRVNLQFVEGLRRAQKTHHVFERRKHELVNDLGREEVFEKIRAFLALP